MLEIYNDLKKFSVVILWSLLGVTAKMSSLNKSKKITRGQVLVTLCTGLFAGFVANSICEAYKVNKDFTAAIISVSALSGENITGWLLINITDQLTDLWKRVINKK